MPPCPARLPGHAPAAVAVPLTGADLPNRSAARRACTIIERKLTSCPDGPVRARGTSDHPDLFPQQCPTVFVTADQPAFHRPGCAAVHVSKSSITNNVSLLDRRHWFCLHIGIVETPLCNYQSTDPSIAC